MELRYGTNPHQRPATVVSVGGGDGPLRVLHGEPSYINILDALSGWQLVCEAQTALTRPAAASFKHVSPAGAAVAGPVDEIMGELYDIDPRTVGPLASAYVRARDADPKSSYGDMIAVSQPVDEELVELLGPLACDGIIAPGYAHGAVATLAKKKNGTFMVMQSDPAYVPPAEESREIFGMRFTQPRDDQPLTREHLSSGAVCGSFSEGALDDLLLGLIVLRYTQSNSVAYLRDGMTLGIGAGQQSRIDCTRLAGAKADTWKLRRHPKVRGLPTDACTSVQDQINLQIAYLDGDLAGDVAPLTPRQRREWLRQLDGVSFVSDGLIPFRDNIDHARRHGVRYVAEPGGSLRSPDIVAACQEHAIALSHTGLRLFRH